MDIYREKQLAWSFSITKEDWSIQPYFILGKQWCPIRIEYIYNNEEHLCSFCNAKKDNTLIINRNVIHFCNSCMSNFDNWKLIYSNKHIKHNIYKYGYRNNWEC